MPSGATIDDSNVREVIDSLLNFGQKGLTKPLEVSAKKILGQLQSNVESGHDAIGGKYPVVKDVTQDMAIARSGPYTDSRKRKDVSKNKIAMNVTGQSLESLTVSKVSDTEFNVGYDSSRSDVVFRSNAKDHGNSVKPKRDPLGLTIRIPTDSEFDAVANEIENALEAVLNGV